MADHFPVLDLFLPVGDDLHLFDGLLVRIQVHIGRTAVEQGEKHALVRSVFAGSVAGIRPGDHDAVMIHQIQERDPDPRILSRAEVHCGMRRVMEESQSRERPVDALLRLDQRAAHAGLPETAEPPGGALSPGHGMLGMEALVQLHAGEYVQIGIVGQDPVLIECVVVPTHVIGGLRGAEESLFPAHPDRVGRNAAVLPVYGELLVEGVGVVEIIAVLVVDAEEVSQFVAGVLEILHALPAAQFLRGRQIIRVLVVVAPAPPSVQMEHRLLLPSGVKPAEMLGDAGKALFPVVVLGMLRVVGVAPGDGVVPDICVDDGPAYKLTDLGIGRRLLPQGDELADGADVRAVGLGHVVVVGPGREELHPELARVADLAQGFPPAGPDDHGPFPAAPGQHAAVVAGLEDAHHGAAGVVLPEKLHVHGSRAAVSPPLERDASVPEPVVWQLLFRIVGDEAALHQGQDRHRLFRLVGKGSRPEDLPDGSVRKRDHLEEDVPRGVFAPEPAFQDQAGDAGKIPV